MCETYKFFLMKDGQQFGPYTAQEMRYMGISGDTLVTEESMNGKWVEASKLDFDDMAKQEMDDKNDVQHADDSKQEQENNKLSEIDSMQDSPTTICDNNDELVDDSGKLSKFNLGAFIFGWIWAVFNGIYWPLIEILVVFIPYAGKIIVLAINVLLAIFGNQLAWEGKKWKDIKHFKRVQTNWALAALCCVLLSIVLSFISLFLYFFVLDHIRF